MTTKPQGKFLVIDGGDGSGKTVQTELLIARIRAEIGTVQDISFPRYDTPTGKKIREYLDGLYGDPATINAKVASILYANDRLAAASELSNWLALGTHVVANRYVAANMGHQGSKIESEAARRAFYEWEEELEYEKNGIPRPDLNVILHVPVSVSLALIAQRAAATGASVDGHENRAHLEAAERTYLEIAASFPGFALVECATPDGQGILSKEEIHERVWAAVQNVFVTDRQAQTA